jgi:hypothetical protein
VEADAEEEGALRVIHGADRAPPAKKSKAGVAPGVWGSPLAGVGGRIEE